MIVLSTKGMKNIYKCSTFFPSAREKFAKKMQERIRPLQKKCQLKNLYLLFFQYPSTKSNNKLDIVVFFDFEQFLMK